MSRNVKQLKSALGFLEEQGMRLDPGSLMSLIRHAGSLEDVRRVHEQWKVVEMDEKQRLMLCDALVETYGRCGSAQEARAVFEEMRNKRSSSYSWNVMLSAYTRNGLGKEALDLFKQMQMSEADRVSYIVAVSACSLLGCLQEGKSVHQRFITSGLESSIVLDSALVNMYGRCGSPGDACSLFDAMRVRNVVCWNTMIAAYAQNGLHKEARRVYHRMQISGWKPDRITFLNVLAACCRTDDGRAIHRQAVDAGLECDRYVGNAVVSMYGRCGDVAGAAGAFDRLVVKDVVSWNAMMAAYAGAGLRREAMGVFRAMRVKPDAISFTIALGVVDGVEEGRGVHARMVASGVTRGVVVDTALLSMYGRFGSLGEARRVFDEDLATTASGVTWNAMMSAYAQAGCKEEAFALLRGMKERGFAPNAVTFMGLLGVCSRVEEVREIDEAVKVGGLECEVEGVGNMLISAYSRCSGGVASSEDVFWRMRSKRMVSAVCWTCMMEACVDHRCGRRGVSLFWEMCVEGVRSDCIACACALEACSSFGGLAQGRAVHRLVEELKWCCCPGGDGDDLLLLCETAAVNMYGKCGSVAEARRVFDGMQARSVVTWNSMIGSYAQSGQLKMALELHEELELDGLQPDSVTFLCSLFACSHLGLMDKGRQLFVRMVGEYGVEAAPAHFGCVVDLLSRAGWMDEAEELIKSMPVQPGVTAWTALLGACKLHNDGQRGARAAAQLHNLEPSRLTPFVLLTGQTLSNIKSG